MSFLITALVGISAGAVCLFFWIQEAQPFVNEIKGYNGGSFWFWKMLHTIKSLPLLWPFVIDLVVTMLFGSVFSMGAGLAGGVVALWISNLFSIYLNNQLKEA